MKYSFTCYGHPNITALHKNTLEFTKDDFVTKRGDCIVGCRADFELEEIKKLIASAQKQPCEVKITLKSNPLAETLQGTLNPEFEDDHEIVIRKGGFCSKRTMVILADRASSDLSEAFRAALKLAETRIDIIIETI